MRPRYLHITLINNVKAVCNASVLQILTSKSVCQQKCSTPAGILLHIVIRQETNNRAVFLSVLTFCPIASANLCSHSSNSLFLASVILYWGSLPLFFFCDSATAVVKGAKSQTIHLSLLLFCLRLTGPEARGRHQQEESMGKQGCLSSQGRFEI